MKSTIAYFGFILALLLLGALPGMSAVEQPGVGSPDNPAPVPSLAEKFTIDGNPAKWEGIAALPTSTPKQSAGMIILVWRADGLYGCMQVKDDHIERDLENPWSKDCVEMWLETDFARSGHMGENDFQLVIAPTYPTRDGKSLVLILQGLMDEDSITAITKINKDGFTIEFFIPVKLIPSAKMAKGTKLGFDYSVDFKGKSVEQFFGVKTAAGGYSKPSTWGAIELVK